MVSLASSKARKFTTLAALLNKPSKSSQYLYKNLRTLGRDELKTVTDIRFVHLGDGKLRNVFRKEYDASIVSHGETTATCEYKWNARPEPVRGTKLLSELRNYTREQTLTNSELKVMRLFVVIFHKYAFIVHAFPFPRLPRRIESAHGHSSNV